jgi:hypothetical protein
MEHQERTYCHTTLTPISHPPPLLIPIPLRPTLFVVILNTPQTSPDGAL